VASIIIYWLIITMIDLTTTYVNIFW